MARKRTLQVAVLNMISSQKVIQDFPDGCMSTSQKIPTKQKIA